MNEVDLLTEDEVAEMLGVSRLTLRRWRWKNKGPKARKIGRHVKYLREAVEAWLRSGE